MCGRYVAASPALLLAEAFEVSEIRIDGDLEPNWNVAPTDRVPAVAQHGGRRLLGTFRWGLVPAWAKDSSGAARAINARAETVTDKPTFREAFAARRCLLPADGFYEWRLGPGGVKQPVFIEPRQRTPVAFAGLWESWRDPRQPGSPPLRTCTIITTRANNRLAGVHERMPVILPKATWDGWLDPANRDLAALESLLVPAADDLLDVRPVGRGVNDVRNNGPELLEPIGG